MPRDTQLSTRLPLELERWRERIEALAGELRLSFYPVEFELIAGKPGILDAIRVFLGTGR